MHTYCAHCGKKFTPGERPPDREVPCPCCDATIRLVGGRPEQEIRAEECIQVLNTGTRRERKQALKRLVALGPSARKCLPDLIDMLGSIGALDKQMIVKVIGSATTTLATRRSPGPYGGYVLLPTTFEVPDATTIRALEAAFKADLDDTEVRAAVVDVLGIYAQESFYTKHCMLLEDRSGVPTRASEGYDEGGGLDGSAVAEPISDDHISEPLSSKTVELDWDTIYEVLSQALPDEDEQIRAAAVVSLGWLGRCCGDEQLVPRLVAAFEDDDSPRVRYEAIRALGKIRVEAKAVLPSLVKALGDEHPRVVYQALDSLMNIGQHAGTAVPAMFDLLHGDRPNIRDELRYALPNVRPDEGAVRKVAEGLRDEDPRNVRLSAEILSAWGVLSAPAVPQLILTLNNRDTDAVRATVEALGRIGPASREAVPRLAGLLRDAGWSDKATAIEALGRIGAEASSSLAQIIVYLKDSDSILRKVSADAIGRIDPGGARLVEGFLSASGLAPAEPAPNAFRKSGSGWAVTFRGKLFHFKDFKGFLYIYHLLDNMNKDVHVSKLTEFTAAARERRAVTTRAVHSNDLSGDNSGQSDGFSVRPIGRGEALFDDLGIRNLRLEMAGLKDRLAEAEANLDQYTIEKTQEEIRELDRHTLANVRGRRPEMLGNGFEKLRKSVKKCIDVALASMGHEAPDLQKHFLNSLNTGAFCSYKPEPSIEWEL